MIDRLTILQGDCSKVLPSLESESVQCCVTSPPYWGLRDYGHSDQLGQEKTPNEYVSKLVGILSEVKRVLKKDGTLWLNIGDSYAASGKGGNPLGSAHQKQNSNISSKGTGTGRKPVEGYKAKYLIGIPWMVAFALRADGWYLRCDIIWHKQNCMPESVTDRPTRSHEFLFLLSKSSSYFYDNEAISAHDRSEKC